MYLKNTAFSDMEWFHLADERLQRQWGLKYGNEALGSIKDGKFLDELNDY